MSSNDIVSSHVPSDPPKSAQAPYANYSAAVEREFRRERRWKFSVGVLAAAFVANAGVTAFGVFIATKTNLDLVQVAQSWPVRYVERGPDGHDRTIFFKQTATPEAGHVMETIKWFVTWSRWISPDEDLMRFNRAEAKVKLVGGSAIEQWNAQIAEAPDPKKGYKRDVVDVVVSNNVTGDNKQSDVYLAQWQEKTLLNGKVIDDRTMMQVIGVVHGPSRAGAYDGVNIVHLTDPTPAPKQR